LDIAEVGQIVLRLAHGLAAAVWVGGGAYYVLAVRPQVRIEVDESTQEFARAVQREFGEWASVATLVMIASGVVLMFERLSGGQGTALYVVLLVIKIVAAVIAFWITGALGFRRRTRGQRRTGRFDTAWTALALSIVAFLLGALLTTIYPMTLGS
jgi:putative copper export protein